MEVYMDLEHEKRLADVENRAASNTKRLDRLESTTDAINRMAISIEKMAVKQDNMSDSIDKLSGDVEAMKAEPGKRWKFVVEKTIYFVVAAVVGFFLARVGL